MYLVQGRAKRVLHGSHCTDSNLIHIQGWMNVRESYSRALKHGTLGRHHSNSDLIHSISSRAFKKTLSSLTVSGEGEFSQIPSAGWFQKVIQVLFRRTTKLHFKLQRSFTMCILLGNIYPFSAAFDSSQPKSVIYDWPITLPSVSFHISWIIESKVTLQ